MNKTCTILLVDDDEDDRMIFENVISEIGTNINCRCFSDALRTLKTLDSGDNEKPDCIFLDLNLPMMHGFEFLEIIKTSKEWNEIPVIIYSTSSRESDKIKAKELGAQNFLSKPSSYIELKNKVTNLLTPICSCDN